MMSDRARGRGRGTGRADLAEVLRAEVRRYLDGGGSGYALAGAAGVARSAVNRFASGGRSLSLDSAGRIAAALGLRLVASARSPAGPRRSPGPALVSVAAAGADGE